jgi:hypothetical protein
MSRSWKLVEKIHYLSVSFQHKLTKLAKVTHFLDVSTASKEESETGNI